MPVHTLNFYITYKSFQNFEALNHAFITPEEKSEIFSQMKIAYGIIDQIPVKISTSATPSIPTSAKPAITFSAWEDRS